MSVVSEMLEQCKCREDVLTIALNAANLLGKEPQSPHNKEANQDRLSTLHEITLNQLAILDTKKLTEPQRFIGEYFTGPYDGYISQYYECIDWNPNNGYWMQMVGGGRRTFTKEINKGQWHHFTKPCDTDFHRMTDLIKGLNNIRYVVEVLTMAIVLMPLRRQDIITVAITRLTQLAD